MEIQVENLPVALRRKGLEEKLSKVCSENDIVFMAIFGSFVRGQQHRKSDVDVAIEFDKSKPKSLLDLLRAENELSKVLRRKVDLGIFSSLSPLVLDDVRKEMRIIYEKR
jgi:uncharacterized protein